MSDSERIGVDGGEPLFRIVDGQRIRIPDAEAGAIRAKWQAEINRANLRLEPVPVSMSVSRFQLREALLDTPSPDPSAAKTALEAVDAFMAKTSGRAQRAWLEAAAFTRKSPTVAQLAQEFGWSDAQVDDLFRRAEKIEA